jgi:hypothetical protein
VFQTVFLELASYSFKSWDVDGSLAETSQNIKENVDLFI